MAAMAATTTATASIILLLALFLAGGGAHAEPAEIPCALPACKTVGGGSQFFDVQFCLTALGSSDGRSGVVGSHCSMDYHAYSVVATDVLASNVTATAAKIDALLRDSSANGSDDEACLRSCQALYGGTVQRQPGCAAAVRQGVDKKAEAMTCLEEAAAAAKECEDGFGRSKVASPVTAENQNVFMLAKLAVALLGEVYANK